MASEVATMEDAVTFLEGLKQKCPNAVLMLDAKQIAALDSDPKASFQGATSNEDFIKLAEAYFSCKYAMEQAKSSLKNALTDPHSTGKKIDVEDQESAIACLKLVGRVCLSIPGFGIWGICFCGVMYLSLSTGTTPPHGATQGLPGDLDFTFFLKSPG